MTELAADPLFDLAGRSIAVIGAGGGVGGPLCRTLAERGARLTLADIDVARLKATADALPDDPVSLPADITSRADCAALVEAAVTAHGRLDGMVNAAGLLPISPAETTSAEEFQGCYEANVTGALWLSQAAAKAMAAQKQPGGAILHFASVSSFVANVNYVSYATSKAALAQMVRVLAREWAPKNIRVNAIGPALIETPLTQGYLAKPEFRAGAIGSIPMGRLAEPEDLFGASLLLLGKGGGFITGQTIYVDGGRTLT